MMPVGVSDLAIVGGGPTGLSAAITATSEGLSTVLIDCLPELGGQAKFSSRIENFLGFPSGVTGPSLTSRATNQAEKFGTHFLRHCDVTRAECEGRLRVISLADGNQLVARAVLLACGLDWRRLPQVDSWCGKGVSYGASMGDGPNVQGKNVFLVGGANSAGQAANYLSQFAASVTMIVRGDSLREMSEYLVDRITKVPNIRTLFNSQVLTAEGNGQLQSITVNVNGTESNFPTDHLFLFIGADPKTTWLQGTCELDQRGYIVCDGDRMTKQPGIFAAGDVRSGSIKRIAAGVGDGALAVSKIHNYLDSTFQTKGR